LSGEIAVRVIETLEERLLLSSATASSSGPSGGWDPAVPLPAADDALALYGPTNFGQAISTQTPGINGWITGTSPGPKNYSNVITVNGRFSGAGGGVNLGPNNFTDGLWLPGDGHISLNAFTRTVQVQTATTEVRVNGNPTGGTFTLNVRNNGSTETTAPLPYNFTAADLQAALAALPGYSGVRVTGSWLFNCFFPDASPVVTIGTNALTGGTSPNVVATRQSLLQYGDGNGNNAQLMFWGNQYRHLTVRLRDNLLEVTFSDSYSNPSHPYNQNRVIDLSTAQLQSLTGPDQWFSLTVTLTATGTLSIAIEGQTIPWDTYSSIQGGTGPWTDIPSASASAMAGGVGDYEDGVVLGANDGLLNSSSVQPSGLVFSDDYAFGFAQNIGAALPNPGPTQVTVDSNATSLGTVNQGLRGTVSAPISQAATNAMASVNTTGSVVRLAISMTAVEVENSNTGATTQEGPSGLWYNMTGVYRDVDAICAGGAAVELNFCYNNQYTGGTIPAGLDLSTGGGSVSHSHGDYSVPSNPQVYATLCTDLYQMIVAYTQLKGYAVDNHVSLWNEPGPGSYWNGTESQFMQLFCEVGAAFNAMQVPGLEFGTDGMLPGWVNDTGPNGLFPSVMAYNQANPSDPCPLNFIGIHTYSGIYTELAYDASQIDQTITSTGWDRPVDMPVTEAGWSANWLPLSQSWPLATASDYYQNAFFGSWLAQTMMFAQSFPDLGYVTGVSYFATTFTTYSSNAQDHYFQAMGSYDEATNQYGISANIKQMWAMMGDASILYDSTVQVAPGVSLLVAKDASGDIWVMASYNVYASTSAPNQDVDLSLANMPAAAQVRQWIAGYDSATGTYLSDDYDGGAANQNLESGPNTSLDSLGVLEMSLSPQSVTLFEVQANAAPVQIVEAPANQQATAGAEVSFAALATGSAPPTSQWQSSANGVTWTNIAGATGATLSFSAPVSNNGWEYRDVFTNLSGTATTPPATLTVTPATAPSVTTQPLNLTISSDALATFTSFASGTLTPSVQWQVSTDGGKSFAPIRGATATTYTLYTVVRDSGFEYEAVFTNAAGSVVSQPATLTVTYAVPQVWGLNLAAGPTVGGALMTITGLGFTGAASVDFGTTPSPYFTAFSDTTITAFIPAESPGTVDVTVTGPGGTSGTGPGDQYTFAAPPLIVIQPTSQSVPAGSPATFSAAASGYGTVTIQWSLSTNGGLNWNPISGATAATYVTAATTLNESGYEYEPVFTDAGGSTAASPATLTVTGAPQVSSVSPNSGPASGGSSVTITGSGFTNISTVTFGTLQAVSFNIISDSTIMAVAPAQMLGTVDVKVTAASSTSVTSSADQFTYLTGPPVAVKSVVVNGNISALAGAQRSMVDSIVYTFSEAVSLAATGAFAIAVHAGEQGSAPTLVWTAIAPDANGASTQWVVTFTGTSVVGNSIATGVYDITLNPAAVTSEAQPKVGLTPRATDTFFRLYGDYNGDGVINALDNLRFKLAITTYNPIFDYNNDGVVNASDNLQFKKSVTYVFNAAFTLTI
jgi:hypothetical protein